MTHTLALFIRAKIIDPSRPPSLILLDPHRPPWYDV